MNLNCGMTLIMGCPAIYSNLANIVSISHFSNICGKCIYICVYICVCVCVCIYIYIYIYTYLINKVMPYYYLKMIPTHVSHIQVYVYSVSNEDS